MRSFSFVLSVLLAASCATPVKRPEEKKTNRVETTVPQVYPTAAILDLGRSAYLKGCVDGMGGQSVGGKSSFEICKSLSVTYEQELKLILNEGTVQ